MNPSILIWNRLETTTLDQSSIDKALRFELRDPLWMLARQWQFGEFDGEDAGAAAFAGIETLQAPVSMVAGWAHPQPEAFDARQQALEMVIERIQPDPDLTTRAEMGRQFIRLLRKSLAGVALNNAISAFKKEPTFQFRAPAGNNELEQFQNAPALSDSARMELFAALGAGRQIDGYALYQKLAGGNKASVFLSAADEDTKKKVNQAGDQFLGWCAKVYQLSKTATPFWNDLHQEYQVQIGLQVEKDRVRILNKEEYHGEGHSWHGWTEKPAWAAGSSPTLPGQMVKEQAVLIPSAINYRGMPHTRLWEMEDGAVNFGSIQAGSTELSKMIFAEFGLIFGNDWLSIPIQLPAGHAVKATRLVITDLFGHQSTLSPEPQDADWAFFQTLHDDPAVSGMPNNDWLLLANLTELIKESKPVEKVTCLRDETANLVWAVESIIKHPVGGPRSGDERVAEITRYLSRLSAPEAPAPDTQDKLLRYQLGTTMPENWIPFVPVYAPQVNTLSNNTANLLKNRQVLLQRAALPRFLNDLQPERIRPATQLLGANPDGGKSASPLGIFEEEIPRSGMELSLVWRRLRWYDGRVMLWQAKKKNLGRGEVFTNFGFDRVK